MELPHFSSRQVYMKSGTYAAILRLYTHYQSYAHLFENSTIHSSPHISDSRSKANDANLIKSFTENDLSFVGKEGHDKPLSDDVIRGDTMRGIEDINSMLELDVPGGIPSAGNIESCALQQLMEELDNVLVQNEELNSQEKPNALPQGTSKEQIIPTISDANEQNSNRPHVHVEENESRDRFRRTHNSNGVADAVDTVKHSNSTIASTGTSNIDSNKRKLLVYEDVLINADVDANEEHISAQPGKKSRKTDSTEQNPDKGRVRQKRGPLSEERKEKKRRKFRMKRAAKLREQGVKRLEIKPAKAAKPVCRHFLNGRCHESENCKFSHDAVPLTKSKPCCHLATNSCLKGDSCPYDHQLSKYPCLSLSTKGFCNRGSSCLFSHEIAHKPVDPPVGNGPKLSGRLKQPGIKHPKPSASTATTPVDHFSKGASQIQTFETPSPLMGINFLAFSGPKSTKVSAKLTCPEELPFSRENDTERPNPFLLGSDALPETVVSQSEDLLGVPRSPYSAQRAILSIKAFSAKVQSTAKLI